VKPLASLKNLAGGAAAALASSPFSELQSTAEAVRNENQSFHFARHRWLAVVARDPKITGADLRVAVLIWEYTNADWGYAWPSMSCIATEMSLDRSTVLRSVSRLERRGWIRRTQHHGRFRSNEYRFSFRPTVNEPD
jgi:DNA-binding MarR family transcriptional regulator